MKQSIIKRPFTYSFNNVSFILMGVNLLVFLLGYIWPNLDIYLAMNPLLVTQGKMWWQFLTYMFVHGGFQHLFVNMIGLFFFGPPVERRLGSKEFLLFYLLTGVLAGVFSFCVYYFTGQTRVFLVGASGAIYAVLLAFAVFYPDARILLFFIVPIRAPVLVLLYTVVEILSQITGRGANVAHLTHLAGFAFAYLYMVIRLGINPLNSFFRGRRGPWDR